MKLSNLKNRALLLASVALVGLGLQGTASAACDPYASLISAVNFSTVTTDVVAVAALVVAVLVAIRGIKFIYKIVRS